MLLDTSGFFSLYSENDGFNSLAVSLYLSTPRRLTTNYVLAEYVALALVRGIPRSDVIDFSQEILNEPTVEIVWVDEVLHSRAVELIVQRPDKKYSLCDAVSFVLMRERAVSESLTTDKHFEQEGFVRLLTN
jgi:predicted nucleic acid-binding protein